MTDCHYLIHTANVLPSTQRELCSRLHSLTSATHTLKLQSGPPPTATTYLEPASSLPKAQPSPGSQVLAETLKVQWCDYNKIIPTRISWRGQSKRSPVVPCRMNEGLRELNDASMRKQSLWVGIGIQLLANGLETKMQIARSLWHL